MAAIPIALPIVWLAALVLFAVAEAATVSLVSIWFAGGALIDFLVSLFTNSLLTQCIVFLAVSALCLALVRPVARKHFSPRLRPTNADRLLGAVAVVTQEIDNRSATGQVKVSGQIWTARSQGEDPIPVGTSVTVLRIEGVKLIVQAKAPVPV